MQFNDALYRRCDRCRRRAGWHRLTKQGVLYCLKLNTAGNKMRKAMAHTGEKYDPSIMHHISVKYLCKSSLHKTVGQSIQKGLGNVVERETEDDEGK